jgi:hypothetical protein
MQPLDLLILSLATWRAAYFVAKEAGPFGCMAALRARFPLGGLTSCVYCASVWSALAVYGLYLVAPWVTWVIAASGGALFMHRWTGGDHV